MDRLVRLTLVVISIYLITITISFTMFLNGHTIFEGTEIVIYLVVFTISAIMLTFLYDNNVNKYIAYPLYGIIILGVKTFYDIFIDISDLPINGDVRYDFDFYIYYTHFSPSSFDFKVADASAFLYIAVGLVLVSFVMYLSHKSKEDNHAT